MDNTPQQEPTVFYVLLPKEVDGTQHFIDYSKFVASVVDSSGRILCECYNTHDANLIASALQRLEEYERTKT